MYGVDIVVEYCVGVATKDLPFPFKTMLNWGPLLLAPFMVAWALVGRVRVIEVLGLASSWKTGVGVGLLCTAPLICLFALTATWAPGPSVWWRGFEHALLAGFAEELFFRAMLFGLLFRVCGWSFVPACSVGMIVFGCAHAYQGASLMEILGIVGITGFGAAWFSWLYARWNWNLWLPATLHVVMNLSWVCFELGGNALGSGLGNLGRGLVVLTSVVLTVWRTRDRRSLVDA